MRNPRSSDEERDVELDTSRQGLLGGTSEAGILQRWDLIAIVVAIVVAVLAAMTLDTWALWVVLGGIVVLVVGIMISISPNRGR